MDLYKKYVDVIAIHRKSGKLTPMYICWEDGRKYKVDQVLNDSRRVSPVGGCGVRYVCMVQGQRKHLFLEKDKWFVESCQP